MQIRRLGTGAAALAFSGLAVLGTAGPVLADHNCPNPAGKYPAGQCDKQDKDRGHNDSDRRGEVNDSTVTPGQPMNATARGLKSNETGRVTFESTPVFLTNFKADSAGVATVSVTVPADATPGRHNIVFTGDAGSRVAIPVTVVGSSTAASGSRGGAPSSLPFTGSGDLVPLTAVGVGMVALGAGVVVAARRRRSELDASNVV